jgi:hypothetical protein
MLQNIIPNWGALQANEQKAPQERGFPRAGVGRGSEARRESDILFFPLPAARGEVGLRSNPGEGARLQA